MKTVLWCENWGAVFFIQANPPAAIAASPFKGGERLKSERLKSNGF